MVLFRLYGFITVNSLFQKFSGKNSFSCVFKNGEIVPKSFSWKSFLGHKLIVQSVCSVTTKYRPNTVPLCYGSKFDHQTHFLIPIKSCELRMWLIFYSCPFELELENVCRLKHRSFALYPLLCRVTILWWLIILRRWLIVKTNGDRLVDPILRFLFQQCHLLIWSAQRRDLYFLFRVLSKGFPDENRVRSGQKLNQNPAWDEHLCSECCRTLK